MREFMIGELGSAEEAWPLRHRILRPTQSLSAVQYSPALEQAGKHWGAWAGEQLIAVASLVPEAGHGLPWRLRGMAVDPAWQGQQVGASLLAHAHTFLRQSKSAGLWCHARTSALGFYKKLGYTAHGEEFDIPGGGPHFLMTYRVF